MSTSNLKGEGMESLANEVLDVLPAQIVVVDRDANIFGVNAAYRNFSTENGGDGRTIKGLGMSYIAPGRFADANDDHLAAVAREGLLDVLGGNLPSFEMMYPCDSPEGPRWFLMSVEPLKGSPNHFVASHTNITKFKKSEQALHGLNAELHRKTSESSEELEHFFAMSLDMNCIANINGFFTRVNHAFTTSLGWSEKELTEQPFVNFVHPDDVTATAQETADLADATTPRHFENRYRHKDGSWRILSWNSVSGGKGTIFATARDVTEQREMEAGLRTAKEEAEAANMAKSEFLSRMSHELRTPMNAVLGYAQLLEMKHDDPSIRQATNAILKGGRHLLQLINEVLDLSRIESGNFGVSIEPVSMEELVNEAIFLLKQVSEDAGVFISKSINCEGLFVEADRQRFLQVLLNVIGNGIKFNRRGGRVELKCLDVEKGVCRVEISDTGYGIPAESQSLLFQPFQRFGDPGIDGSGLGLAVSERFMKLMGGKLSLAHSSPEGSTFMLELKWQEPQAESQDIAAYTPKDFSTVSAGTVLYIEDNLSNISLLETILADWNDVRLIPVTQGQLGLTLAESQVPDLILLDVHLPDLMGDKVLARLKSNELTKDIPVVMLSADVTRRQINACLEAGAAEYLTKLDIGRLYEILNKYLPVKQD